MFSHKGLHVEHHFLELEPLDGIQFRLHFLNRRLAPVDFKYDDPARSTKVFARLVQSKTGLDVARAITQHLLEFKRILDPVREGYTEGCSVSWILLRRIVLGSGF